MSDNLKPGRFAAQLAALIDDNINISIPTALVFEQALAVNPNDVASRNAYHDWLLENDCPTRAAELAAGILDQTYPDYHGEVRPEQAGYPLDWAGF